MQMEEEVLGEGNPARPGPLNRNGKVVDIQLWQQSSFFGGYRAMCWKDFSGLLTGPRVLGNFNDQWYLDRVLFQDTIERCDSSEHVGRGSRKIQPRKDSLYTPKNIDFSSPWK